jgi:23S rRNA (adenine2503-C2)-methyltransferase
MKSRHRSSGYFIIFVPMNLFGHTAGELAELLRAGGQDASQASLLAYWIHRRGESRFERMYSLPKEVKRFLASRHAVVWTAPRYVEEAADGTRKYLFDTPSGMVEAVYIPDGRRHTLCVSTQAGCRWGCRFCRTGMDGFRGSLSAGSILNQLQSLPEKEKINHVVFMGMGEPLENTEEVLRVVSLLTDTRTYALAARNITLSTIGLLPGLRRVLTETRINVTVSLHSPFPEERARLMPVEKKYPFLAVLDLLAAHPPGKRRRYSVAYTLFEGVNDSREHLAALTALLRGRSLRVNLLPYHAVPGLPYRPAAAERLEAFRRGLLDAGISCTVRRSRGEEIAAACGLLSGRGRRA